MWSPPDSSARFVTLSKTSAETAGVGEGPCCVPWAATTLRGKRLIWRMVMEAVSRSNAPAVNWGTRLERPGSSPGSSSHGESDRLRRLARVSPGGGQPGASASQLEGRTGRTHQRGNSREKPDRGWAILQYWRDWRLRSYLEKQERRISRGTGEGRVFEGVLRLAMAGLCLQMKTGSCPSGNVCEQSLSPRHAENGWTNRNGRFCYSAFGCQD